MRICIVEQDKNEDLELFEDRVCQECEFWGSKEDEERHLIDVNVFYKDKKNRYYAVIKYRIEEENN